MTLHVFGDTFGLYPSYVVENVHRYGNVDDALFVNLVDEVKVSSVSIELIGANIEGQQQYINSLNTTVDKIVFHPYQITSFYFLKMVKKRFPNVKVFWVHWSYELYNLPSNYLNLLDSFSRKYYLSKLTIKQKVAQFIQSLLPDFLLNLRYRFQGKAAVSERTFIDSFKSVDTFFVLLYHDYKYLVEKFNAPHIAHKLFAYLSLEKMIPSLDDIASPGSHVMIGHSAGIDGNHYEIITKIAAYNLSNTILLPLAYGDEQYKQLIIDYAKAKFAQLDIQDQKLAPEAYYQKLKQVGFCIINVKVQQGIGNITALLWYGVKVFLCKESSTYKDFKNFNLHIFSIEDDLSKENLSIKLSESEISNNRFILKNLLGDKQLTEYWANFM